MNDEPLDKLFQAGRAAKPDTSGVEFGFETRLIGRIRAEARQPMPWFVFTWKLIPYFAAIVLALGAWNLAGEGFWGADWHTAIAGDTPESWVAGYLTGD